MLLAPLQRETKSQYTLYVEGGSPLYNHSPSERTHIYRISWKPDWISLMSHGRVTLACLLASSRIGRGVDEHWWCVAILCDCFGVQRAALCCVVWFQVDRETEGFPLTAGRDTCGCERAVYYPKPSSITPTVQTGDSFCLHAQYVFMIVCGRKTDYKSKYVHSWVSVCVLVCIYLQHLACWVQGVELEGCTAPTHTLHEILIGITTLHTLIHSKAHSQFYSLLFYLGRMSATPLGQQP